MKKIILSIISLTVIISCEQNKKQNSPQLYEIISPIISDSVGNITITKLILDHKPTKQDSIKVGFPEFYFKNK